MERKEIAEDLTRKISLFKYDNTNESRDELATIFYLAGLLAGEVVQG